MVDRIPGPLVPAAGGFGAPRILLEAGVQPAFSAGFLTRFRAAGFPGTHPNSPQMGKIYRGSCAFAKLPDSLAQLLSLARARGLEDGHALFEGARLGAGCHRIPRSRLSRYLRVLLAPFPTSAADKKSY